MRWIIVFFSIFLFSTGVALAASPAQVYITQVQTTGGPGKTNDDFIELFNPGSTPVDLKGYRLVKRAQNSQTDTLIKSWSTDAIIPPKSFYLWANSSYTNISVTPDTVTSATISDNNGVALRFGANDTGQLVDGFSWGNANNGFPSATGINPGAGQAIFRQDWYALSSSYFIATPKPYNSNTTDFTAAFNQANGNPTPTPTAKVSGSQPTPTGAAVTATPLPTSSGQPQPSYASGSSPQNNTNSNSAKNYLILAIGALLALGFLAWRFFFHKSKK